MNSTKITEVNDLEMKYKEELFLEVMYYLLDFMMHISKKHDKSELLLLKNSKKHLKKLM
jgi:hypothetical protein